MISFIILGIIGTFCILLGLIIWKFKISRGISTYDETKITDPDGFARWNGKCLMVTGIATWLLGSVSLFIQSKNFDTVIFILFMFLAMISGAVTLTGTQRYHKS